MTVSYPLSPVYSTYIVRGLTSGLYKIGRTQDLDHRMQSLACRWESIALLAVIPGPWDLETHLHIRFSATLEPSRGREWFRDEGAITDFLGQLPSEHCDHRVFVPGVKRPWNRKRKARHREACKARKKERMKALHLEFVDRFVAYRITREGTL